MIMNRLTQHYRHCRFRSDISISQVAADSTERDYQFVFAGCFYSQELLNSQFSGRLHFHSEVLRYRANGRCFAYSSPAVQFDFGLSCIKNTLEIPGKPILLFSVEHLIRLGFACVWLLLLTYNSFDYKAVSYTHLRAHETRHDLVCRLLLEKKKKI